MTEDVASSDRKFLVNKSEAKSSALLSGTDAPPVDKGKAVYLTLLLYGIGILLPFSVIISCLDYYATTVSVVY